MTPEELKALLEGLKKKLEALGDIRADVETLKANMAKMPGEVRDDVVNFLDMLPASQGGGAKLTGEDRELARLTKSARLGRFIETATNAQAIDGAEAELSKHLEIPSGRTPLALLAPDPVMAVKAQTDAQPTLLTSRWLDRLFAASAAMFAGVNFDDVPSGAAAYPVTTAGAGGVQRGRGQAVDASPWTVGVTELKPSSNVVQAVFSSEDAIRVPGLEQALRRDMRMAISESVDRAIFTGDAGANEPNGDITGFTGVAGLDEQTITQANKVKGPETLAAFAGLLDGIAAGQLEDLRVVAAVAANKLWTGTLAQAAGADSVTVKELLMRNGLRYQVRAMLADDATDADDFAAIVGRGRNIMGSAVAAIWRDLEIIRDPYSGAGKREVALTATTFWNFGVLRPQNWARCKFVA